MGSTDDCYFYYYSNCTKGKPACPFRHEPAALAQEVVCTFWKEGKCTKPHCIYRHMDLDGKKRNVIPCYWEKQPSGCTKPHCPFLHDQPKEPHPEVLGPYLGDIDTRRAQARGIQDVPAMPQKSKIIVNKRKIDELKDQALLPDIDYADLVNQTRARTSGIKRKLPVKARLGINPTSQHPTAGKVSVIDRLGRYPDDSKQTERKGHQHIVEVEERGSSSPASSGDELNSEEEALRRNAIQTLDLRKRLTTSTPVRVSSKIHVSPTLLGGLDAQKTVEDARFEQAPTEERRINFLDDSDIEEYDPENPSTKNSKDSSANVDKAAKKSKKDKKSKKEKKERKLMKKVNEGTASKKDLKKLKKLKKNELKLLQMQDEADSGALVSSVAVPERSHTEEREDENRLDEGTGCDEDISQPSLADRVANRQTLASEKRKSSEHITSLSPKKRLGAKRRSSSRLTESPDQLERRKIVMSHSGDESDEDEEGPRRSKAKARKVATKADDKVTTPKKEKAAIRRPSIQTEEVKSMIADVDSLLSKSNTNPEKEKSTIQAEEVKSMISDVDSLLSKSDVEGLLSPSKASPSKTVKAVSSASLSESKLSNAEEMKAVEDLEALLN